MNGVLTGLAVSVAAGLCAQLPLALVLRSSRFKYDAAARFVLCLSALVAIVAIVPAFALSEMAAQARVPEVHVSPAASSRAYQRRERAAAPVPLTSMVPHTDLIGTNADRGNTAHFPVRVISDVFLGLWLGGVCLMLLRLALGMRRLHELKKRGRVLETRQTERGSVPVLYAGAFDVPVALGYRRPAVVLPTAMLDLDRETDLENVLLHELEHLRRYDDVTSLIQAFCVSVLWFNPFARAIAGRAALEREMACDEAVVARTGAGMRYASTLWKIAAIVAPAPAPLLLSAFSTKSQTVPRLENLLLQRTARHRRRFTVTLPAALLCLLLVGAAALPQQFLQRGVITNFTSVRLPDGETLVVGGLRDGRALVQAQLYDRRGKRTAVLRMHTARWSATVTILRGGGALVTGGLTERGSTAAVELYDPRTRRFRELSGLRVARWGHTATVLRDGTVLIAGGQRFPGRFLATSELYNPITERSAITADGPPRAGEQALLIDNGSVLMFGGRGAHGPTECAVIYDPSRHGYHNAGRMLRADARSLTFELDNGQIRTYRLLTG